MKDLLKYRPAIARLREQEKREEGGLLRIICCIWIFLAFIISIGFFGLIINKSCVFIREPIKQQSSTTPVLDKVHVDVEKVLRERK